MTYALTVTVALWLSLVANVWQGFLLAERREERDEVSQRSARIVAAHVERRGKR